MARPVSWERRRGRSGRSCRRRKPLAKVAERDGGPDQLLPRPATCSSAYGGRNVVVWVTNSLVCFGFRFLFSSIDDNLKCQGEPVHAGKLGKTQGIIIEAGGRYGEDTARAGIACHRMAK
ncbi:hypothetical protein EVAR_70224_1 [Eumeta japonica]|uniref:Uncharacterized protein n=1 Tax=Eumeta variegata TaxID=151549 RepID=A0A4C1S9T6_EUMVA|nr:hypothetical protein EVAR_70224_1 [Eumeta japonica]